MLRWILLSQAVIYLLIMPFLHSLGEAGYHPPLLAGLVGVLALGAGVLLHRRASAPATNPAEDHSPKYAPREHLWIGIVMLAVIYSLVSLQFGLLNRRQGSEMMAEVFGTLPLWALAIVRGYEISLPLIIILYAFADRRVAVYQQAVVGVALLFSLPFMGIEDSRGRILVLGISVLAFVPATTFFRFALRRLRVYLAGLLVLGSFIYFSAIRAENYYSFGNYMQVEVVQRLDGLNLVSQLRDARLLSYGGEFDPLLFSPLVSKIPFLDAAREAKLMGRTSSKQYFIQSVLRKRNLDESNSMIADPLYFGGLAGLILFFMTFGYLIARFDSFIARGRLFEKIGSTSIVIAFGTSFIMFEADFVFAITTMLTVLPIVAVMIASGCRRIAPLPPTTAPARPFVSARSASAE